MIEFDGATLRVSAAYAIKVPGAVPYSSEDAHYSMSLEIPVDDGANLEAIAEQARSLAEQLTTGVKLMVFTELDVAFEDSDGTLRPVLTTSNIPTAAPKASAAQTPAPQGRPASGNAPSSDRSKILADLGFGTIAYLDNRPKKASGDFKPGAADFRSADKVNEGRYHSVWIAQKDGTPNAEAVEALTAAGVSV